MAKLATYMRTGLDQAGSSGRPRSGLSGPTAAFWSLLAIIVVAVLVGGGGSKYAMANLIVQLTALMALSFHRASFGLFWCEAPLMLKALVFLSLLLPLLYTIPLPPGTWAALPGRELVTRSHELIGYDGWASASVDPVRTLLAATALITPLAVLTIGWTVSPSKLILAGWAIVALGLANVAIGVPQVLSNSEIGVLYPENPMPGVLFGTFANRNTTGLFLVAALAFASLLPMPPKLSRVALPARWSAILLLVIAIVLTRSRTALVLALVPVLLAAIQFVFARLADAGKPTIKAVWIALAPVMLGGVVIGGLIAAAPGRVVATLDRFEGEGDNPRAYIWEDALYSADRYWPVGAGSGTFDEVFQIDESLENLTLRRAGRAHNDYIEVAIEAGLPGVVLIAAWLALLVWMSWRARHGPGRWIAWSGASILWVIALQCVTDYPLRNQTMLAIGAFALVLLVRFSAPAPQQEGQKERHHEGRQEGET